MKAFFIAAVLYLSVSLAFGAVKKTARKTTLGDFRTLTRRMSGGTAAAGCDYPSLIAISGAGAAVCNGIYIGGVVRVSEACAGWISTFNGLNAVTFTAGDGTSSVVAVGDIAAGSASVTNNGDGTADITLSNADLAGSTCISDAVLYDSAAHSVTDLTTCSVVSYGGTSETQFEAASPSPDEISLVTSDLQPCCDTVLPNLLSQQVGGDMTGAAGTFTCATTSAAMCVGDVSAPIYCPDTNTGNDVVIGMVVNSGCSAGETFAALDLTGGTLTGFSAGV